MLHKIYNHTKGYFSASVPDGYKSEFELSISMMNAARAKITAATFIVLQLIQLAVSAALKKELFWEKPDVYYLVMYVLMLISMTVFLLAFIILGKHMPENREKIRVTGMAFVVFVLTWCVGISLLDQLSSGQIIMYSIAMMAAAVTPLFKPGILLAMCAPSYLLFIFLMPYFQKSGKILFVNYINSLTFLVFSVVITAMRYKSHVEDFNNRIIIQEKNKELEMVNAELEEANRKLEKLSQTDSLTGICNRYIFDLILRREWDNCKRSKKSLSLIMIDIDFFKAFNDNYGHPAGDYCIREVAKVLSSCAKRSSDTVARYGGDEFAIILPDTDKEKVLELAEHMRKKVEELAIPHKYSTTSQYLTISLGVCCAIPSARPSMEEFIRAADNALYEAKKEKRNSIATA